MGEGPKALNTWRYVLEPSGEDGTDVTEFFALSPKPAIRLYWTLLGPWRGKTNANGMRATLEGVKAVVEGPHRGPRSRARPAPPPQGWGHEPPLPGAWRDPNVNVKILP